MSDSKTNLILNILRFYGALGVIALICIGGCNLKSTGELTVPQKKIWLSKDLNEISGLQYLDTNSIAAIQDEKGKIYWINRLTGVIDSTAKFGDKGDYEGLAYHDGLYYILKSNGTVYKYSAGKKLKKCRFHESKGFDFEGLCVDVANNRLLVACKRHGKKSKNGVVRIYQIAIDNFKYSDSTAFKIPKKDIKTQKDFEPSGIAIHPNGDIYIISSVSDALLILNGNGKIKKLIHLEKTIFEQPEGITFDKEGRIYISNEKRNADPVILQFDKI